MWPIGNLGEGLIKLSEFISDTCALNVKDSHYTRLEATAEQRQRWVRGHAQGLIDGGRELVDLVHGRDVPEADGLILAHRDNDPLSQVEVQVQDLIRV